MSERRPGKEQVAGATVSLVGLTAFVGAGMREVLAQAPQMLYHARYEARLAYPETTPALLAGGLALVAVGGVADYLHAQTLGPPRQLPPEASE